MNEEIEQKEKKYPHEKMESMSVGGFQREGIDVLWCVVVCSVTATIVVTVADYLYEKISGV